MNVNSIDRLGRSWKKKKKKKKKKIRGKRRN
jgi:hypothetical protein